MAVEKIILASKKFSNNWWSITDNNGREISIGTINKKTQAVENQKLNGLLVNAEIGSEVEVDVRDWQGKFYGNDPKSGGTGAGGKTYTSDKPFDAAKVAAQAAGSMLALQKEPSYAAFEPLAEKIHAWILSKKSS